LYVFASSNYILTGSGQNMVRSRLAFARSRLNYHQVNVDFGVSIRAGGLMTLPDSTSQKFLLVGRVGKKDREACGSSSYTSIFLRRGEESAATTISRSGTLGNKSQSV
jgi:hypothetical protein